MTCAQTSAPTPNIGKPPKRDENGNKISYILCKTALMSKTTKLWLVFLRLIPFLKSILLDQEALEMLLIRKSFSYC